MFSRIDVFKIVDTLFHRFDSVHRDEARVEVSAMMDNRISKEYQKYEFCKMVKCEKLQPESITFHTHEFCEVDYDHECKYTAKQFHKWLHREGYKIAK